MRGLLTIYRRELAGLFYGPLAWALLAVAVALSGLQFVTLLEYFGGEVTLSLRASMGATTILLLLPPLLTMRMLSEESRSGMLEFLLTAPIRDWAVVAGKFLAALTFMALFWSVKLGYGLLVQLAGAPPDWPQLVAGYAGAVLASGLFCAVGLLASALTSAPVLAAFLAIVGNWLILDVSTLRGRFDSDGWSRAIDFFDSTVYLESFLKGVVDTGGVVFFAVWTLMLLFLATRAVETRRWR